MDLRVLMLGWELPPYNSGGLGVACLGLARSLSEKGADVIFVLPKKVDLQYDFMKLLFANVKDEDLVRNVYKTSGSLLLKGFSVENFPSDYVNGAYKFAEKIGEIAKEQGVDVIHVHDWMTFPAGMVAKSVTGKPLVVHMHATEFDRTGGHAPNEFVYQIEKEGLRYADKVISVSQFTKNVLVEKYEASPEKIEVVHNGVEEMDRRDLPPALNALKDLGYKVVLYLGRITLQKGPEYFIRAAEKVLDKDEKVVFVVAGTGDMQEAMIAEAARLGILDKCMFTGFVRGDEKRRIYQAADVYVLPSVSEPFGITPLEAIANGTPAIVSKQSGVSEVLEHALKVDFWDTEEMANKILAVLNYKALSSDLKNESAKEIKNVNWGNAAEKCMGIYNQLVTS